MREWLPRLAIRRPVTVLMLFLAFAVTGFISLKEIPLRMMPAGFEPAFMYVWVPYWGSTPSETDAQIVTPVIEHLATAPGLKEFGSRARSDNAGFPLQFHQSTDMDEAYNQVADRMERAMAELPEQVESYGIWRYDPSDEPIIWAGASIDESVEDPHYLMHRIVKKHLERVPGVATVDIWGTHPRYVFIDFDRDAVNAYGVLLHELMGQLMEDNFQMASGRVIDGGQVRFVRSLARWDDMEELRNTKVKSGVKLQDIATVSYRTEPSASLWHVDGKPAAGMAITKTSSANTVDTARAAQSALIELERDPRLKGMHFDIFFDQGKLIEDGIGNLKGTALAGGLFAVIVLFVFLREARMTLLIAASIPMSLIMTVSVLYFTGGSLNLLSLMGLMIAVGMVVDNAIVVVETIYARRQDGESSKEAAVHGTAEVGMAITLSTLTTMVVFLPLILMTDDAMFSFFMGALGFPVVYALGASLIVALVFTPLTTIAMKHATIKEDPRWIQWLQKRYERSLRWLLGQRFDGGLSMLALLVITMLIPVQQVGCTDQEEANLNDFQIEFEVAEQFGYLERKEILGSMEAVLESNRDDWGIRVTRSWMNSSSNHGEIVVYLQDHIDGDERQEIREEVVAAMPERPGLRVWSRSEGPAGHGSNVHSLSIRGEDTDTLLELGDEAVRRLRSVPEVVSAELEIEDEGSDEIRLHVDREATARTGVNAESIGQTLAFALRGWQLNDFHDGHRQVEVYSRFQLEDRRDLDSLLDFQMWSPISGGAVPLRALTHFEVARGFGEIERDGRQTQLAVRVELDPDIELEEAMGVLRNAVQDMQMPRGYGWDYGSRFDQQLENDRARNMALLLSVSFVFIIMGILFESLLLPLSIITTIPMALAGVYWTLYLTSTPLDMMGGVGLVILIGVVVNNGIVLVDLVTQLRQQGLDRTEALIQAGRRRMRPILMTALTTICGLLPMALGSSGFIGMPYAPLARVVGGGIAAATVLTLFLVPFLYSCLDDLRDTGSRLVRYART